MASRGSRIFLRASWIAGIAVLASSACSFPWDDYTPTGSTSGSSMSNSTGVGARGPGGSGPGGAGGAGGAGASNGGSTATTTANGGAGGSTLSSSGGAGGGILTPGTCGAPYMITDSSSTPGDNTGTPDSISPTCFPGGEDQLYELTASITGVLVVDVIGASDLGLVIRTQCGNDQTEVDCEDNNGTGEAEEAKALVAAGEKVFIGVDAYDMGDVGPYTLTVSIHPLVCGDGIVDPTEACDPPNGVTCSATCQGLPEMCGDNIDNDLDGLTDCEDVDDCGPSCPLAADCATAVPLLATNNGNTGTGTHDFAGSCVGNQLAPEKLYTYTASSRGALILDLASGADLGLHGRNTCTDPSSETFCLDNQPGGMDEVIAVPFLNGQDKTIFVDGYGGGAGAYTLTSSFVPVTENEPNNTPVQANAWSDPFIGTIEPISEEDWIRINVPAGGSLTAETVGLVPNACNDLQLDSQLDIYDTDGTTVLGSDDDGGVGYCSFLTVSGLSGGTYFVKVSGYNNSFAYQLNLTVN